MTSATTAACSRRSLCVRSTQIATTARARGQLPTPKSCPALIASECERWRVNSLRCRWLDGEATCKARDLIDCFVSPPPPLPPEPLLPARFYYVELNPGEGLCDNACALAADASCDDGGPGAAYGDCPYGTDCDDCDERLLSICSNTCYFHDDGSCDDGVRLGGALWDECAVGTDCADCGVRPGAAHHAALCRDTCVWSSDQSCDDGGPGSAFELCELGTDCVDCGGERSHGQVTRQQVANHLYPSPPPPRPPPGPQLPPGPSPPPLPPRPQPLWPPLGPSPRSPQPWWLPRPPHAPEPPASPPKPPMPPLPPPSPPAPSSPPPSVIIAAADQTGGGGGRSSLLVSAVAVLLLGGGAVMCATRACLISSHRGLGFSPPQVQEDDVDDDFDRETMLSFHSKASSGQGLEAQLGRAAKLSSALGAVTNHMAPGSPLGRFSQLDLGGERPRTSTSKSEVELIDAHEIEDGAELDGEEC